jgi:hypothetical protein
VAPASSEAADLRARAERCRNSAREYASEIGALLVQLAAELDHKADQIDPQMGCQRIEG